MNLLTFEEIAERLHISVGSARNRLSRGEDMPPSFSVGRRRLFPEDDFNKWILEKMQRPDPMQSQESYKQERGSRKEK